MHVFFGTDYYPEHWPRERWEVDATLMAEMGIDVVRLAEFSWHAMEPSQGVFTFEWLDEAIEVLAAKDIRVVLGTPSAAPPAWVIEKHPEIQPVDFQGVRRHFGGRHHDCQSNHAYRKYVKDLVTAMAERYAANPNVIGWQTDNELGNSHEDLCFCESCAEAYRIWLEKKYHTIEELNQAWGTRFWSQGYNSFKQVTPPRITAAGVNPSAMLDWKRFCSDLIVDFQQMQIDILREKCPHHFITHNIMGFANKVNYYDLAENLDFISQDQYPGIFAGQEPCSRSEYFAASLDVVRGIKDKSFWIMEQQGGIIGWECMSRRPNPGQLALWAVQSIAHGADTIVFFRWRTCTIGTEQFWHGILPHDGLPGARYKELQAMIEQVKPLMPKLQGGKPKAEVGIVFSYDQSHAVGIQPQHPDLDYVDHLLRFYKGAYQRNMPVDFVSPDRDFSKYKVLIAPLQYLMNRDMADKYREYVNNGGKLVMGIRSGVKDQYNRCYADGPLPGLLADVLGITISDYDCLCDTTVQISWGDENHTGSKWSDLISCTEATALAAYSSESYAGTAAVTVNYFGCGEAYYIGTEPDDGMVQKLFTLLERETGLLTFGAQQKGLEVVHRVAGDQAYVFVLNHGSKAASFSPPGNWIQLAGMEGDILEGFGYKIYELRQDCS